MSLLRRAGDANALAALLPEAAQAAAAAGDPARAAALWREQAGLLSRDAPAAALAALALAHAAAPGDPGVLRAQAELAERTGDLRLALAALRALLGAGPPDAAALEVRAGRAALTAGELAAAREHASRAEAAAAPGAAELLDEILSRTGDGPARADLLVRMGRLEEAATVYQRAGRPADAAPLLFRLGRYLEAASAFHAAHEPSRAAEALARAAEDPASASQALPPLVELRLAEGDAPAAAAALLKLARLREGGEAALLAWRAHGLDPSPAAVEAAALADPGFAPARAARAALRADTDPRGALTDAEAALTASEPVPPGELPPLLALAARAAAALGDLDAERRHLAAYCELSPGDAAALERLASLHRGAGDRPALAALIDRSLGVARGPDASRLRVERAELAVRDGDVPAAARLFTEALEGDRDSLGALRGLTEPPVSERLPPDRRAELLARRAAHPGAAPEEVSAALSGRARLLSELGQDAAALEALRQAAALGPEDDANLELRATLAARTGQAVEAARALLDRAERARARGEPGAAERLAEAGLLALPAGLPGAEEALSASLALGPGRESERAARQALIERARGAKDAAGERLLLSGLVPLLRTGERPAALLRLAELAVAEGDRTLARRWADEARALAPRDPAAVEAARAAAEAQGDQAAVIDRLGELAELVPEGRGQHLLARARLLASLGRAEEADREFKAALALLPADAELAEEHMRLRRDALPGASAAEPLEAFAGRTADRERAARAFRAAAALALAADDRTTALRCARRAHARSKDDPIYAGPLLARILYQGGSWAEALVLHRRLFEAGLDRLPREDALALARQLADLAEEGDDGDLARAALEQVLAIRPSDLDAAMRRFALDPDRARAARDLAAQADFCRSASRRAEALAAAAEAALGEIGDAPLADLLFRRARDAALRLPDRAAAVALRRVEAFRAAEGTRSPVVVEALGEAAEQALKSGNRAEAKKLLTEAAARARDRGQLGKAAASLFRLAGVLAEEGEAHAAAGHAREAGDLFAWSGMLPEAAQALRRAVALEPADAELLALVEAVARARGAGAADLLVEVLEQRIARAQSGAERAELRVALAEARLAEGGERAEERAEAELRLALQDDPASGAAAERLGQRLAGAGRDAERARLLLERASHQTDRTAAAALRREAAALLAEVPGAADRAIAAATFAELAADDPGDLEAHRAAALLYRDLGQRERSIAHLAALVRADPDDEAAAKELAEAYSSRHRERAELFLSRAEAAQGETRAARLREGAKALFAAGEDAQARAVLLSAFQAWPADDTAFVAALREATADVERIDAVLSARAAAVPAEATACHRARADALLAFGEADRAVAAYEAALSVSPDDVAALAALAACFSTSGRDAEARTIDARLLERARAEPAAVAPSVEASARFRLGLAAWAEGRPADGIEHLERALSLAPADDRAGVAWAALASGHAARGDAQLALAAARSRLDRATALGLSEERRQALEAGGELCRELAAEGRDAAEILSALLDLRAAEGEAAESLVPLARRTAAALRATGEAERARKALARAGIEEPEEPAPAGPGERPLAPVVELFADRMTPPLLSPREAARRAAERALSIEDPQARSAAFVAYAEALGDADAPADEVRGALDLAADADPDAPEPWRARARLESGDGQPLAAARAHLSVSIRTEGEEAARSALEAARLFEAEGLHGEAARAYRAAVHAQPGCVPARRVLAEEALATGDAAAAAGHLAAVSPEALPAEERPAHARRLARAFEAAGQAADAEAVWTAILQGDPQDGEAFEHAAALARARGALDTWIDLAQLREQSLARAGDDRGRADLRCERGKVLAEAGRLEAARGAILSALELVPGHAPATEALSELDGRRDDWGRAAADLSAEAAQSRDPAERAALHLRRAHLLLERLKDAAAAAVAAEEALVEARTSPVAAARRTSADAEALLRALGQDSGEPPPLPQPSTDPVSAVLRAQAEAARGAERAELFERLAGHLERSGDRDGAADALLAALEADPDRELTHSWLRSVAAGDTERLERADKIRSGVAPAPGTRPRTTLRFDLGGRAGREPPPAPPPAPQLPPLAPRAASAPEASFFPPLDLGVNVGATGPAPGPNQESAPAPQPISEPVPPPPAVREPEPNPAPEGEPAPEPEPPSSAAEEVPWAPPALPALDLDLPPPAAGSEPPTPVVVEPPILDLGPAEAEPDPARRGRERLAAEDWELAYADLSEALDRSPGDTELLRDLLRAAEKAGHHERFIELGETAAEALAVEDALAAAARLRQLAEVAHARLGQPERAAQLLEKALALVPGDPDTHRELAAVLAERPRNAPRALESWLAIARQDPSDAGALSALAALCGRAAEEAEPADAARLFEQGRIAASLAAFLAPSSPRPPPARLAPRLPAEARAGAVLPAAYGPSARLLALLAPWLEPLFPADLARRGASSSDWLAPPRAPALRTALETAARVFSARPHAAFLTRRSGVEVAIENTQPPAIVFSAGVADLPEGMLPFLAARTLDLVQNGWALAGKFAPRDVGILLELACRFAGGNAPSLGLPAERAGSYLGALARAVPAGTLEKARLAAADSAGELTGLDPRTFAEAVRYSANRTALLYAGDPGEALRVLAAFDPSFSGGTPDPAQVIALPEASDLAQFALSDAFLEQRLSVLNAP
ncbi:MAG TPA: tetratricopeptide repeat protein [Anaeromyxobacter sp.]|nr:tetratricopeptide repeat protein [Anaeromyxobacter sp.]